MSEAVISTTRRPIRRKGSGARTWMVVGAAGEREEVEAGRQLIMRRTGLTAQDLRILDPLLSYSSTIVGRERAIVINLEHIKAIITAHEVLLLNSRDPSVIPFVDRLHHRILRHRQPTQLRVGCTADSNRKEAYDSEEPKSKTDDSPRNTMQFHDQDGQEKAKRKQDGMKILPFEFVALEACLEAACTALENEAKILEQEAHTALDKLTSKVSTLNLERVRHIKSRLVAITGRVQKVKDELENLLDDDEDMSEMYLTNKLVQQPLETSSTSSMNDGDETENQVPRPDINNVGTPPEIFGASNGVGGNHETYAGTAYSAATKKPDVEELEMLLEAYFVQIGGTLNKLFTLNEYVDDTEDYVNIMLDEKQNKLLQMEVRWETVNVLVEAFITVTGIFAINVHNKLWDTNGRYLWSMGGCTVSCILLYLVANAWYKRKRLLD